MLLLRLLLLRLLLLVLLFLLCLLLLLLLLFFLLRKQTISLLFLLHTVFCLLRLVICSRCTGRRVTATSLLHFILLLLLFVGLFGLHLLFQFLIQLLPLHLFQECQIFRKPIRIITSIVINFNHIFRTYRLGNHFHNPLLSCLVFRNVHNMSI